MTLEERMTKVAEEIEADENQLLMIESSKASIKEDLKGLKATMKKLEKIKQQINEL